MSLNIVFAGTPDFAAQHLAALLTSEHNIVAVYTQPDRPAGRGKKLQPSAVKQLAVDNNITVLQPESLKSEQAQQQLAELNADIMVVVAYGLLLPQVVLDTPKLGCINVHGSILPRWRGAAPIQRSLWAGDEETGVTIMQMDIGLDTGDMLHIEKVEITAEDTSASLYQKLAELGPKALLQTLSQAASGQLSAVAQNEQQANYAAKLSKSEALIDWQLGAEQLERNVRAFNPWPMAYFSLEDDKGKLQNIKVWQSNVVTDNSDTQVGTVIKADKQGLLVKTADQALNIVQLQIPGKKPMPIGDVLNGNPTLFKAGDQL